MEITHKSYLGVLRLRRIEIRANPHIPGELDARHEVSDEHIPFLHDVQIEEVWERLAVEERHDSGIHVEEEGKGWGHVGAEDGALMLFHPLPVEVVRALEPEVVKPV